ncbi:type IV pilus modification protein PilV [Aeromonas hydrophila]|uniref:type IV pilus modification protein PilV n=1 Tax=Aeromonas hydrophila TaxID=644 RepID=UPI00095681A9|nr:type IV pilus modification protein PilV [Aeromonas hydrophila]ELM3719424.1 type IV pilus modification protein PilV [Aeromonas hydrophila]MBL0570303.1 type IV pilus modification protein PilV [Aeromonas hydrophila]MCR3951570.1 type IV pilus modification protein PilV [Aeromonas hydrophila]MCW4615088.1 type IV pilus modification protein PilV [Aeromonas hydrophila]WAF90085.1 type IV pilus modification protein PilV [Aeromonas hydrophila]
MKWPILSSMKGFSLLEVMIAAVVLSFGLLGLVGMQVTSKLSGYEARQRTIASWLATDIVERARINRSIWELQTAQAWTVSSGSSISKPSCGNEDGTMTSCSANDLLALDMFSWQQSLLGVAVSGASSVLQNPSGCIIRGNGNAMTVIVTWQGRESISDGTSAISNNIRNLCGFGNGTLQSRRYYMLATTL